MDFSYKNDTYIAYLVKTSNAEYSLDNYLGQGGNGVVCLGANQATGENVAIKFLTNDYGNRKDRFEREIEVLKSNAKAKNETQGLISYIDAGTCVMSSKASKFKKTANIPFVIMEFGGKKLSEFIKEKHPLDYESYAGQFLSLASGLKHLHSRKIVHRDIKPDNILALGGTWALADFGLCSAPEQITDNDITRDGENLGPRFWLSPEESNRSIDHSIKPSYASDVFQLAAVFWFVINKTIPVGIVDKNDWKSPDIKFRDLLLRSLQHESSKRPQDGNEFFKELERIIEQE